MTAGQLTELALRSVAFAIICGIIGYILFVLTMWFIALCEISVWIFMVMSEGWPGG
ncbi:hypothetical protein SEA_MEDIUMFRY_5 [Arthrobacter phage MediumFry]|nr:hypothetical protein SEA_CATERPILLAR_5 [Arthrobacter phage Caterpillar]AXH44551.1 hypothetical protein SEA_MEDIUMFRY_5 [Arthrobacter phage MediumFry]